MRKKMIAATYSLVVAFLLSPSVSQASNVTLEQAKYDSGERFLENSGKGNIHGAQAVDASQGQHLCKITPSLQQSSCKKPAKQKAIPQPKTSPSSNDPRTIGGTIGMSAGAAGGAWAGLLLSAGPSTAAGFSWGAVMGGMAIGTILGGAIGAVIGSVFLPKDAY